MNDNLTKLLEQLASKLGTTTEYLWGILVKQAYIDATITLVQTILVIVFGIVLYKLHRRFMKVSDEKYAQSMYEKYEEGLYAPMVILSLLFVIFSIICVCSFGDIINGYFNPEYWALKQILNKV